MGSSLHYSLMRLGEHLTSRSMHALKGIVKYLEVGFLMRQMGYPLGGVEKWVREREELFDIVQKEVGDRQVLYLEFGVYQGAATRYWSKLLSNPKSKLHGFDSFEGLPEDWHEVKEVLGKGHFSTGGAIPVIEDERVRFFKGWFSETLAGYEVPEHDVLVVNFDADLYSSTQCVFNRIASYIVPGTYLYFDEFNCTQDEMRAFREFCSESHRKFALRGSTRSLQKVLFQCVA
jgi:O-methyltransferase